MFYTITTQSGFDEIDLWTFKSMVNKSFEVARNACAGWRLGNLNVSAFVGFLSNRLPSLLWTLRLF